MFIVITGTLLAGKSTLQKALIEEGWRPALECTTRPMRKGETNHVDYHFLTDEDFDRMEAAGEFAETLHVETIYGLWKYGIRKSDLKEGCVAIVGPHQIPRLIESIKGRRYALITLAIEYDEIHRRAIQRGDDLKEVDRRFEADAYMVKEAACSSDLVLDAKDSVKMNTQYVLDFINNSRKTMSDVRNTTAGYVYQVDGQMVQTAQKMTSGELEMYLSSNKGFRSSLRMHNQGMPKNPIRQIAWLLLSGGGGCGYCKVCREEECGIDEESCTTNIANYIRKCVHDEDEEKEKHA